MYGKGLEGREVDGGVQLAKCGVWGVGVGVRGEGVWEGIRGGGRWMHWMGCTTGQMWGAGCGSVCGSERGRCMGRD